MIVVKMSGGLGNQLFQYAAGRSLSIRYQTPLKLDISSYENSDKRSFKLEHFNIHAKIATQSDIQQFYRPRNILRGVLKRLGVIPTTKKIYEQREFVFDERLFNQSAKNIYLKGYWQNETYFEDIHHVIHEELQVNSPLSKSTQASLTDIFNHESVSIHIRRGDYASEISTNQKHGLLPLDYYENAIQWISTCITNPKFYVFSDDGEWVKDNLSLPNNVEYMINSERTDIDDFRLLSACKHHIIANSTFSWWGAWLSQNPDKIIVAPKQWLSIQDASEIDIIPSRWHVLDSQI